MFDSFCEQTIILENIPTDSEMTKPQCAALHPFDDGSAACCLAIEAVRFEIAPSPVTLDRSHFEHGLIQAVHSMLATTETLEFYQVLTNRVPSSTDGSAIRFGWVVVGRGGNKTEALRSAQTALFNFYRIISAFYTNIQIDIVADPQVMNDLVKPLYAPFITALRRAPFTHSFTTVMGDQEEPSVLPELHSSGIVWEPLIRAIALPSVPTAFVVHAFMPVTVPQQVIADAERDAAYVQQQIEALPSRLNTDYSSDALHVGGDVPVDRTMSALQTSHQSVFAVLQKRITAFKNRCASVEISLNSWEPIEKSLVGVSWACSTGSMIPVKTVTMTSGALWSDFEPLYDPCFSTETLYTPSELWSMVRLPEPPVDETSPLPCSRSRILPLRTPTDIGTCIGRAMLTSRTSVDACINVDTRLRHVYIVGQTGTGKSTLLLNMAIEEISRGNGITILDPHGSLVNDILERIPPKRRKDVVLVDPSGTGRFPALNPLAIPQSSRLGYTGIRDRILDELIDTFDVMYNLKNTGGPMFERYFRTVGALLMGSSAPTEYTPMLSMFDIIMSNRKLMEALAKRHGIDDPIPGQTIKSILDAKGEIELANVTPYITSKLARFLSQSTSRRTLCRRGCIDFDNILAKRKILLVDLSSGLIGSESAALIARQIILRLSVAALERGTSVSHPAHYIYADEFHHFASEQFASLLSEARKFRIGLVLAHQYTSQLKHHNSRVLDAVLGNVGTVITFRVGMEDAKLLGSIMAPQATVNDICGLPDFQVLVRSTGMSGGTPFSVTTRPRPPSFKHSSKRIKNTLATSCGCIALDADRELDEETKRIMSLGDISKE